MKSLRRIVIAGALMLLTKPAAAMAYDGCYGWGGYHPGPYAYRDMRFREHDLARDRYLLNRDRAYGDWRAARAERADMNRDYNEMRQDRFNMYRYGY